MKKILLLLMMLPASMGVWAETKYITEVMLIGGTKTETDELKDTYTDQGWTVIDQDLNAGCGSSSDYIYLLYKEGSTASPNHTFVTHFLISDASGTAPDTRDHKGHRYKLVPYDGGDHFKQKKGDLNSNAGGDDIHLYYTTEIIENMGAVSQITFNATQSGGINTFSADTGYDLNDGAGGDYIYMHCEFNAAPGWDIQKSSDGSQCYVRGLSATGLTKSDILAFPAIIAGAAVVGITGMNFSELSGLKTIYFSQDYDASTIPSANLCRFLKNVHIVDNSGIKIKEDELPASVTSIADGAFTWTKLETLKMPNVTSIGNKAFSNCHLLTSVTFPSGLTSIGNEAFYNCALTSVAFPSGLTSIGTMAFYSCDSLTSITLPSSLTSIGNNAFYSCSALISVTISGNPTMGARAFPDATTLVLKPRTNNWDDASWTTFYNDYANFKAQGAAKVYKATVADGKVVLTEVKDKIVNAGTAVVLKTGKSNNFVQLNRTTDTSSDILANELHAENAPRSIPNWTAVNYPDHTFYLLGNNYGVGYYRYLGDMMPQNEAFLALPPGTDTPQMMPIVEYQPFAITLPESFEHGSVTCDKTEAAEGETVTLTVTPDDGYELETLTVTTVDATTGTPLRANVDLISGENATYTFLMPAAPVTVSATFMETASLRGDVNEDDKVDVSDVNMIINMILGKQDETAAADLDGSGNVDVSDVNVLITIILGK
ncbi:MAG: leucine-rich repeat protein [Muribaculaceae bacterium]|nr:leucine-rich repeat protein [Muribaculaceae bacterium]